MLKKSNSLSRARGRDSEDSDGSLALDLLLSKSLHTRPVADGFHAEFRLKALERVALMETSFRGAINVVQNCTLVSLAFQFVSD
jgi:hypothetical protein